MKPPLLTIDRSPDQKVTSFQKHCDGLFNGWMKSFVFLSTAASHLQTFRMIEQVLSGIYRDVQGLIVETSGFYRWSSASQKYEGRSSRQIWESPLGTDGHWVEERMLRSFLNARQSFQALVQDCLMILESNSAELAVTVKDYGWPDFAFLEAARQLKIPSVLLQEGPLCKELSLTPVLIARKLVARFAGLANFPFLYGEGGADLICVSSAFYADKFQKVAKSNSSIKVTGLPRYDLLSPYESQDEFTPTRIFFVATPVLSQKVLNRGSFLQLIEETGRQLSTVSQQLKIPIAIRPHPGETENESDLLSRSIGLESIRLKVSESFLEQLKPNDVVIGWYSNCLLEAKLLGNPSFYLPHWKWRRQFEFLGLPSLNDLVNFGLSKDRTRWGRLSEEVGPIDGKSSDRVVSEIRRMLEG